jgi:hypothetical protein
VPLLGCLSFAGGWSLCVARGTKLGSSIIWDISSTETLALEACFLRVCGFIEGDCRIVRDGVLAEPVGFRFIFLAFAAADAFEFPDKSMFKSIGDVVGGVSELGALVYTGLCWFEFCASSAGDVSGLKYAPGTVYSGIENCDSNGVTAGETSGVKDICFIDKHRQTINLVIQPTWSSFGR